MPTASSNVRVRGQSGKHMLVLSSSQSDPDLELRQKIEAYRTHSESAPTKSDVVGCWRHCVILPASYWLLRREQWTRTRTTSPCGRITKAEASTTRTG